MPKQKSAFPKLCRHVRGHAFVRIEGRQIWLGPWRDPATHERYDRLIGEWLANGRKLPLDYDDDVSVTTVAELILQYWEHLKDRCGMGELEAHRISLRVLRGLYGSTPAAEFGPNRLRAVRAAMIERGWVRQSINKQIQRIRAMFRCGASFEIVPEAVHRRLLTLAGLKRGEAEENPPVKPASRRSIRLVRRHLAKPVRALVDLQLLTGARSGELLGLRPLDFDMSGAVWRVELTDHKTAHLGKPRVILFGPKAQRIVRLFLDRPIDKPLFSPMDALAERHESATVRRRPNQKPTPRQSARTIGDSYTVASYRRAIHRAIDGAVPAGLKGEARKQWKEVRCFNPHRLRHNAATFLRRQFGVEVAQTILGHATLEHSSFLCSGVAASLEESSALFERDGS